MLVQFIVPNYVNCIELNEQALKIASEENRMGKLISPKSESLCLETAEAED